MRTLVWMGLLPLLAFAAIALVQPDAPRTGVDTAGCWRDPMAGVPAVACDDAPARFRDLAARG